MRARIITIVVGVLLPLALGGCNCGPPSKTDAGTDAGQELIPTTNAEQLEMLRQLGFSTTVGTRVTDAGAVPDRWHPLRTRYAAFYPRKELYVAGGPVVNGEKELMLDDGAQGYASLPLNRYPDQTWINAQYKNGIAVDVDDDGREELFIVYFAPGSGALKYMLLDPQAGTTPFTGVIDAHASADSLDIFAQPSLATGDLDGDGRPEIAVGFGKLYVLSNLHDGQATIVSRSYEKNDVNVAIGNIDLDPADELVVTHTETKTTVKGMYEIFDGDLTQPFESGELRVTDSQNQDHLFAEAQVAIGEVDVGNARDHVADIVFHGRRVSPGGDAWHLFLMRYTPTPKAPTTQHFAFRSALFYTGAAAASSPRQLTLTDLDGDGVKEIYGWGRVVDFTADGTFALRYGDVVADWPRALAANIDSDRRDDLLVATNTRLLVYGLDALDNWVIKKDLSGGAVAVNSPVLAAPNIDDDSAIVRYDGEYELLFTNPQLVAVMASPPWQAGVGQDVDSTTATYGKTQASTVVEGQSLGVSIGFSVGFEYESDLFQSGVSAKTTFEAAFDFYANQSKTLETYHSDTTAPGTDKVIFTTVPFDVYYYTIVSSPRASEVGKRVTVNLPRQPQVTGSSIEFYNAHNGGGLDVDARILMHTAGDVWSYPSVDDRNRLLSEAEQKSPGYQRLWNGPAQVRESGSSLLGLSTKQGSARGASMDFSTTFEFEGKTGGATVGTSVGFHYGHSWEFSSEQGAVFEGSVGAIPAPAFSEWAYCYGLMVYPQVLAGQRFVVLNWWTQQQCSGG